MAVQSDISSITYTGNNSTTLSYTVPFYFLENSHLAATQKVTATGVETPVTLVNHIGAGTETGGTVRTAVAVPATSTLTIYRTVPATQTTDYQEGGDFPAASHERALDKLTMLGQQNFRKIERAIRVTEVDAALTPVVAAANTVVSFNASKQTKLMTPAELKEFLSITGTTLTINAGVRTFADAVQRAAAVPDYEGQMATQRDTDSLYVATGTNAGDWTSILVNPDTVNTAALQSASVTTAKLADGAVTAAKIDPSAKIGGATGAGTDRTFYENDQSVNTNYTITTNKNAMSAGPITIASGVTVTVPDGSTWTIV
jgi:hypothetical protein